MRLQYNQLTHKQGDKCPVCHSTDVKKKKGVLVTRDGKFGVFLSCSLYPDCKYATKAVKSDKRKHIGKKTRRGKKKSPVPYWKQKKIEEAQKKQAKMKRELAQHFQQANRLMD